MSLTPSQSLLALTTAALVSGCASSPPEAYYPPYMVKTDPLPLVIGDQQDLKIQSYNLLNRDPVLGQCTGDQHSSKGVRIRLDVICATGNSLAKNAPEFGALDQQLLPDKFNSINFTSCTGAVVTVDPRTLMPGAPMPKLVHGPTRLAAFGGYEVPAGMAAITSPVKYRGKVYNSSIDCQNTTLLNRGVLIPQFSNQ